MTGSHIICSLDTFKNVPILIRAIPFKNVGVELKICSTPPPPLLAHLDLKWTPPPMYMHFEWPWMFLLTPMHEFQLFLVYIFGLPHILIKFYYPLTPSSLSYIFGHQQIITIFIVLLFKAKQLINIFSVPKLKDIVIMSWYWMIYNAICMRGGKGVIFIYY